MIGLKIPRAWEIADGQATPESLFLNRRKFLAGLGVATLGATVLRPGRAWAAEKGLYAAKRNATYKLDRPITDESVSTRYNNFYEFTGEYDVWKLVGRFKPQPWTVRVSGLVHKPQTLDVSQLLRQMPLEERLYRHRCVEAWSMAVPWTGFPFKALIDRVQPTSDARYVRLLSFLRPDEAPNQKAMPQHPWPQAQGLTLAEAMNELAFLVTGMYGHELPKQNGAPIRLAVPWKYGFKSLKSIVSIEFIDTQPHTFWSDLYPGEYHFLANVNPKETYQGKSQSTEKDIGTGELLPTLPYNGYGPFVAHLYAKS
jgi:sulfoxide reductase catalytic subunit YedY